MVMCSTIVKGCCIGLADTMVAGTSGREPSSYQAAVRPSHQAVVAIQSAIARPEVLAMSI